MRRSGCFLCVVLFVLSLTGIAGAESYTFQPDHYGGWDRNRHDLFDLDHYKAVTWGIDGTGIDLEDEVIVGASLSFDNIRNWDNNPNDLYIRLLDDLDLGVDIYNDGQASGDYFASWGGIELEHYKDLPSSPQDLTYEFDPETELKTLVNYLSNDGIFGLTFDADCHFWNDGVSLKIDTAAAPPPNVVVPEPSTILLLGFGLIGILGLTWKFGKR